MIARIITDQAALRVPSARVVPGPKAKFLGKRLEETASDPQRRALGLAAPQIGARQRMFFYNLSKFAASERGGLPKTGVVCNPTVVSTSERTWDAEEGCLSFPRQFIRVVRPRSAVFSWETTTGEVRTAELSNMPCRVWLHEIDHLDGLLMIDRAAPGAELRRM